MSTSALLLIALASVVLLLLLVIKAKAHPFVALLTSACWWHSPPAFRQIKL